MAIQVFSNKPKFCTRPVTLNALLDLAHFGQITESQLETGASAFGAACGDPNLGTTFFYNVVHQVIRCGGRHIDLNFMLDMFKKSVKQVETKRWFNHYICDPNLNIYIAANSSGTTAGGQFVAQVLRQNHAGGGTFSLPSPGYILMDKDNMLMYTIISMDTTIPFAHKMTLQPNGNFVGSLQANRPYLILPTRMIGGYSTVNINNKLSSIGYSQEVQPLRLRSDWQLTCDLLKGYLDRIQYAVIYDYQGEPYDAWDVYEAQQAREGLRIGLNVLSFIGSPTTNAALISGGGATIDSAHPGFYGLLPSLIFGGAVVYNYRSAAGFDLEADGEPLFLYQDSLKRTDKFMALSGQKFMFDLVNRTNKMVARPQVGATMWEAFKRLGNPNEDAQTVVEKLGIQAYDYGQFGIAFKKWGSLSDSRYVGSDYYTSLSIWTPLEGITENGVAIDPVEFYQYGYQGWTGAYEEHFIDYRVTDGSDRIGGWCAESTAMAVHCPQLWMLLNPVTDA